MEERTPFSLIFLAGGRGSRMQSDLPKQYHPVHGKPLALHSFEVFLSLPEIDEIVVVCEQKYESFFQEYAIHRRIIFAPPGLRRQDSVFNGLEKISVLGNEQLICVHDSARPLIDVHLVRRVVNKAKQCHAAVAGVQVKSTIKVCDEGCNVVHTLDRSTLWEMQTPQVVSAALLREGFEQVHANNLTITDDVSLAELVGKPVKVVEGCYKNIKVTTPEDLILVAQYSGEHVLL